MKDVCDDLANSIESVGNFLARGYLNISTAAAILADSWVPPEGTLSDDNPKNTSRQFGRALVSSLTALTHECVTGGIQAYSPESGLPIELHVHGDDEVEVDHNWLIRIDDFADWAERNGLIINIPETGQSTEETRNDNRSNKLALMNQASQLFWANADCSDRGTHPDNARVAAWLVQQGFSPTLADKAATIIRPEWAPTGRKPEE